MADAQARRKAALDRELLINGVRECFRVSWEDAEHADDLGNIYEFASKLERANKEWTHVRDRLKAAFAKHSAPMSRAIQERAYKVYTKLLTGLTVGEIMEEVAERVRGGCSSEWSHKEDGLVREMLKELPPADEGVFEPPTPESLMEDYLARVRASKRVAAKRARPDFTPQ